MSVGARLPPAPFLYPIVDAGLVGIDRVAAVVSSLVSAGARLVQVRAKGVGDRALCQAASAAVSAAHAGGALLIVNDRPDVARIAGADGVHVGQEDLAPEDVRRLLPPAALVGISSHDVAQAVAAGATGADYVAIGPVFATSTKERPDPVVGLSIVREVRARVKVPVVAIGGITAANARDVVAAGADGLAVVSHLLRDANPGEAFRRMESLIGPSR